MFVTVTMASGGASKAVAGPDAYPTRIDPLPTSEPDSVCRFASAAVAESVAPCPASDPETACVSVLVALPVSVDPCPTSEPVAENKATALPAVAESVDPAPTSEPEAENTRVSAPDKVAPCPYKDPVQV